LTSQQKNTAKSPTSIQSCAHGETRKHCCQKQNKYIGKTEQYHFLFLSTGFFEPHVSSACPEVIPTKNKTGTTPSKKKSNSSRDPKLLT